MAKKLNDGGYRAITDAANKMNDVIWDIRIAVDNNGNEVARPALNAALSLKKKLYNLWMKGR